MPLKATSSDLNRVSKKEHHQEEGGLAQDVNAQAQVSNEVERKKSWREWVGENHEGEYRLMPEAQRGGV